MHDFSAVACIAGGSMLAPTVSSFEWAQLCTLLVKLIDL